MWFNSVSVLISIKPHNLITCSNEVQNNFLTSYLKFKLGWTTKKEEKNS